MNAPTHREFKVILPMRIRTSAKKQQALNLNVYRNLHFRSLSAQKNRFHDLMGRLLKNIPPLGRVRLHYDVCPRTKNRLDVMNVGSIVDKYFSDCLTSYGVIEDDDYTRIDFCSFGFGGLALKEHVLVTITEIEPRKESAKMRILLDQDDIQAALEAYVEEQGISGANGVELSVNDNGDIEAEVTMGDAKPASTKPTPKKSGGRPAGSKNKPKEDPDAVETTGKGSPSGDDAGTGEGTTPESDGPTDNEDAAKSNVNKAEAPKGKATSAKNLFEDSPEDSSQVDSGETTDGGAETKAVKSKASSIFDDDDD